MESTAKKTHWSASKFFNEDDCNEKMAQAKETPFEHGCQGASSRETKDSESFIEDALEGEDAAAMPLKAAVGNDLAMAVGKSDGEVEDSMGMDAEASKEEEQLLKLTERINGCKCAKEGCNKNYVHGFLYEENGEKTGYCGPCLVDAVSSLSDEQKSTHLEERARAGKEQIEKWRKAALSEREGKTLDEHVHDVLVDPEMPWFSVTRSGIVHIEKGCFQHLIPILEAVNFKFDAKINGKTNKPQQLMSYLRAAYGWIPDQGMCKTSETAKRRMLRNGWDKEPVTMYAEHFDLSKQNGGVPKFGWCEEFLRKGQAKKKRAKERKEAAKVAAIEQVVEVSKSNPTDWMDSEVYQEALGVPGVTESMLNKEVKKAQEEDSKPAAKKTKKKSPVDGKENSNPMATETKKKASTVAAGKRKKCDDYYDSDEDDSDKDESGGSNYVKRVTKSGRGAKKA